MYRWIWIFVLFVFVGCSLKNMAVREVYEIQKPIEIVTSEEDKRPEWTKKTVFEDERSVYFSGGFTGGSDYAVSVRCANAEAQKLAVQAIGQFIRAEFSSYVQGPNTGASGVDRYVSDGIAAFAENLHVQGIRQKEIYYEEMFSPSVMQPTWNVWVQLEMSRADYMKAKANLLQKLRDEFASAGELAAKEKAEQLLEELKRGV